uniref:Uncharacterized protein n=1 Tax=Sphaerodactylus townsendi TaxID=933632 RepID=A0ACB8EWH5_9SAUR
MAELPLPAAGNPATHPSDAAAESPSPVADSTPGENGTLEGKTPCRFFKEGRCRFGTRCRNLHPTDPGNTCNLEDHRPPSQELSLHPPAEKKPPMKTAEDVISLRIEAADGTPGCRAIESLSTIGLPDRQYLKLTLEEPFAAFSWEDLASAAPGVLAIPKHRIQYFKYGERVGQSQPHRRRLWVYRRRENHLTAGDVEKGLDGAAGRQEAVEQFGETVENLDGSAATGEAGGKVAESGTVGHPEEELSTLVGMKQEDEPMVGEEDEENGASESRTGRHFPCHRQRPTHFLAIQVTSSEIRKAAGHIQSTLCKVRPDLAEFCVPLPTLHLTLCLLRLDTPEEIHRAIAALQELQTHNRRLLPPALVTSFQGVEMFHSRVLYMCPTSVADLGTLVRTLEDAFRRKGLTVIPPPKQDTFHLTVVKIPRKLGLHLPADSSWLPPIEDLESQAVEAICLCEVGQGRKTDGFYTTVLKLDLYWEGNG